METTSLACQADKPFSFPRGAISKGRDRDCKLAPSPFERSGRLLEDLHFGEVRKRLGGMLPLRRWFDYARTDPGRFTWMVYEESTPVGLLDLETSGGHTAWATVLVNPELRGRGYGPRILRAMFSRPEARCRKQIKAIVERENVPSLRMLLSLGFAIEWAEPDEDGFVILTYGLPERQAA